MKYMTRIALATLVCAGVAGAADWTGFRGTGAAVSMETNLPTTWSKDDGIRWKVALPGRGLSNPVIADGRVYLTASSGYREKRLHVICLEEATGKKLWERQYNSTGNTTCHPATNMAAPTPVTDGKAVYALFATGDLVALDRDGTQLWYRSLVGDYPGISNQVGMASSPVIAGKAVCVAMDNVGDSFLAGIDRQTGKNLWKIDRPKAINWTTPIVLKGNTPTVLFQNGSEATAVDPDTGKVRWRHEADLLTIQSPVQGENGAVHLAGSVIRTIKPQEDGAKPALQWEGGQILGGYASPVFYQGRLYGVTQAAVTCLQASDGKELWKQRVDGPFEGSPVIGDGKLYVQNRKGRTFVVELGDKPKVLARNDLDDTFQATPAIANGCLYLRSDKYLYCVGAKK